MFLVKTDITKQKQFPEVLEVFCKFLKNFTKFTGKKCAVVYSVIKFLAGDLQLYFEWAKKKFF